ncbi:hypothetical protein TSUD_269190 [Trifolium subterraneum]|uniref:Uncharacterized protein n=1 Tax=Trifolium subterraneum TaxID=3900 RepID=A0A2Z6NA56_TRISU|nr:hypothetical protein TSUD_269190 [Trifolium subterraneum]
MNKSGGSGGGRDAGDGAKMISDSEFRFGSSESRSWTVTLVLVSATTKLKETVVAVLNTKKLIGNPGEVVNMSDEVVVVVVEGSGSGEYEDGYGVEDMNSSMEGIEFMV